MKRPLKFLLKVCVGLIVLVVGALIVAVVYADSIVKAAVEQGGSYVLGTETSLEKASIGVTSGKANLSNLTIKNPQGFDAEPNFFKMGDMDFELSLASLTSDMVDVPLFALKDIQVVLEKKEESANYEVILNNLKRFQSAEEQPATDKPADDKAGGDMRIRAKEIVIKDVSVRAYLFTIGGKPQKLEGQIPEIRMSYDTKEGVSVSELTNAIVTAILKSIAVNLDDLLGGVITSGLNEGLGQLKGLGEDGIKLLNNAGEDITNKVGDAAAKATESLGDAAGKVGDTINNALSGLGLGNSGAGDAAGDKVGDAANKASEKINEGAEKVGEKIDSATSKAESKVDESTKKAEESATKKVEEGTKKITEKVGEKVGEGIKKILPR